MTDNSLTVLLDTFKRNRNGDGGGIYSVCSSHPLVLEAAMRQARDDGTVLLIEATANQVNQFGGYTGMKPADFPTYVHEIAASVNLPPERIILGGDHLGPLCWTNDSPDEAMAKAKTLVADYVRAGFQKIHLDTSMSCAGDAEPLGDNAVAERAAQMCLAAEEAAESAGLSSQQVYVVGTEVPIPGGATEELDELEVSTPVRVQQTITAHQEAFEKLGLEDAWNRVIAIVVQPGVEFSHTDVHSYDSDNARVLSQSILDYPGLVYEAHSTDYQPTSAYDELVRDHFAILKVGPQLTFALREALYALAAIENEIVEESERSNLPEIVDQVMLDEPSNWIKHYPSEGLESAVYRRYSYSDRIRYYWPNAQVEAACSKMMKSLESLQIPLPLISQYLPGAVGRVQSGELPAEPRELVIDHIQTVTNIYARACK